MENNLSGRILHVCEELNRCAVQYLIVGGTAVALHGYFRHSTNAAGIVNEKPDLDFWYNPTYGNYFNLLRALAALGQDVSRFKAEQTPNPKTSFFRYEFEQFTLDLLPELKSSLKFGTAFTKREMAVLNGIEIPFISFDDLVADKAANARPKDLLDIEELKRQRGAKNG